MFTGAEQQYLKHGTASARSNIVAGTRREIDVLVAAALHVPVKQFEKNGVPFYRNEI
jgi:hypothetical protein